jgi:hypothetical protein
MKKSMLWLLATATTVSCLTAGELSPARIPASAKWLLHADLDAMRSSETGKVIFEQIEADHGPKLRAFKRMFSIHLLNDLRDVTLFGDGGKDRAVMLFSGKFDRAHIEDVLKAADGFAETRHAGFTILSWNDKGKTQHASFAADDLLVFSPQGDLLREGLDVIKAEAPAAENPILPAAGSTPLVAVGAKLGEIQMPEDSARIMRHIGLMTLGVHEDSGRFSIRMNAETSDATRAKRLRRVLDGIVALAEFSNADLANSGFQCEINTAGKSGVSAAVSMPVMEWLALMKKEAAKKK